MNSGFSSPVSLVALVIFSSLSCSSNLMALLTRVLSIYSSHLSPGQGGNVSIHFQEEESVIASHE